MCAFKFETNLEKRKKPKPPKGRPARVYCDGIYDLFHYGHARSLEQAKKVFPDVYLLVGVCNDELTHKMKGKTVLSSKERVESVRHCKWVDEVIEDAPWTLDADFIAKHKIDFVAHDDIPYTSSNSQDVYEFVKNQNKFVATQRTSGISTSGIITSIVKDYDVYVRRNLARGVSAKELNLSFLKEQEMNVKQSVSSIKEKIQEKFKESEGSIKNNWVSTGNDLISQLKNWEEKSQEFIKGFSELFDNTFDVVKNSIFSKKRKNESDSE